MISVRYARPEDYLDAHDKQDDSSLRLNERLHQSDEGSAEIDPSFGRVIARTADKIVGTCAIRSNWDGVVQPGRFWVTISLVPRWHGRGLDTRMLQYAIAELGAEIGELATCIREDHLQHADFLEEFGFEERFRSWGAHLDLRVFDPTRFDAVIERLQQSGLRLISYAELRSDENDRKLLDLKRDLDRDVLSFDPIVPSGGGDILGDEYLPAGLIVAVNQQDDFVGMASLRRTSSAEIIDSGLTGVRREYRGRGIATALKVRSLTVAKELGATENGTGGGGTNSPMKRLNQKLGYEVGPEWVTLIGPR